MKRFQGLAICLGVIALAMAAWVIVRGKVAKPQDQVSLEQSGVPSKKIRPIEYSAGNYETELERKMADALSSGPEAVKAILADQGSDPTVNRLAWMFDEAKKRISATGNYRYLENLVEGVKQSDVGENDLTTLGVRLSEVFSKMGPSYDIREKKRLMESLEPSEGKRGTYKIYMLNEEAKERYSQMREEGEIAKLSTQEFASICWAMAEVRPEKAMERVADGPSEDAIREAAARVARFTMGKGSMEASQMIQRLPAGIIRDEAVAEMVIALNKLDSGDEAKAWLATITDEQARVRVNSSLTGIWPKDKKSRRK